MTLKLNLRAAFDTFSGYGIDAVDMAVGLDRYVDVVPFPTSTIPGLPVAFTDLLTKDPRGPYDAVLCFAPPFDLHPSDFASHGRVAVGWTMWERSRITIEDMEKHGWENEETGVMPTDRWWSALREPDDSPFVRRDLDLLLVTCPMNVDAFAHLDPHVPLEVLPCGIDPSLFPEHDRSDHSGPMRFAMCGMLTGRKDPFTMLTAWRELKWEHPEFDAILELKTSCPGLHPAMLEAVDDETGRKLYPDVKLHLEVWSKAEVVRWMHDIDVMVSVSRGEGNNKPAMEFMATGGPVIATDWSGHQNWLHVDVAYPLRGTLVDTFGDRPGVQDFRVDVEHLKETILHVWRHPEEARRKGERAARFVRQSLSWDVICQRLAHRLEVLAG